MILNLICHYSIESAREITDEEWEQHKDNIESYILSQAKAVQGNADAIVRLAGRLPGGSQDRIMPNRVELKESPV